jgi:hypothetical protein
VSAHATTSLIVDGALEEEHTFHDETLLREYVSECERDAAGHGYPTQLFVIFHDHEAGIECECIQFSQDHHPYAEWNA